MHAIDVGINLVDISPYYGRTLSEERVDAALAGHRHDVVLDTKCGRYIFDEFDFSERLWFEGLKALCAACARLRRQPMSVVRLDRLGDL